MGRRSRVGRGVLGALALLGVGRRGRGGIGGGLLWLLVRVRVRARARARAWVRVRAKVRAKVRVSLTLTLTLTKEALKRVNARAVPAGCSYSHASRMAVFNTNQAAGRSP